MSELFKAFGRWGLAGLLAGVALVIWVEPSTAGGVALLVVLSVVVLGLVGGFAAYLFGSRAPN